MRKIGFDLDNTIIDYSNSVLKYCSLKNIANVDSIEKLRKLLKKSEVNQEHWIEAQSWIYGPGLKYSEVAPNFVNLCSKLKSLDFEISVFSHKTQYGPERFGSQPFRALSLNWIANSVASEYLRDGENIHFFDNLDSKINSIKSYKPDIYIDDLLTVFTHKNYNKRIKSFLYRGEPNNLEWLKILHDFKEVEQFL